MPTAETESYASNDGRYSLAALRLRTSGIRPREKASGCRASEQRVDRREEREGTRGVNQPMHLRGRRAAQERQRETNFTADTRLARQTAWLFLCFVKPLGFSPPATACQLHRRL